MPGDAQRDPGHAGEEHSRPRPSAPCCARRRASSSQSAARSSPRPTRYSRSPCRSWISRRRHAPLLVRPGPHRPRNLGRAAHRGRDRLACACGRSRRGGGEPRPGGGRAGGAPAGGLGLGHAVHGWVAIEIRKGGKVTEAYFSGYAATGQSLPARRHGADRDGRAADLVGAAGARPERPDQAAGTAQGRRMRPRRRHQGLAGRGNGRKSSRRSASDMTFGIAPWSVRDLDPARPAPHIGRCTTTSSSSISAPRSPS